MRDKDIVAAVRAMRMESPSLWTEKVGTLVPAVDELLRRAASGEPVGDELLSLLTPIAVIREELARLLVSEEDSYRGGPGPGQSGYMPLAGHGEPSSEIIYTCPVCGYTYPVFEVGEPVPEGCPDGHGPLVRVV